MLDLDFDKISFYNPSRGDLTFNQTISEIFGYISQEHKEKYEIVVGCDSSSGDNPNFPVALVVLRKGRGGRFFLTKVKYGDKKIFYSLRDRILEEVYLSCAIALKFRDVIKDKISTVSSLNPDYEFEYIHADVGTAGPTKEMIKEVTGLIKSSGFEPKIKPYSFAASIVADRFS